MKYDESPYLSREGIKFTICNASVDRLASALRNLAHAEEEESKHQEWAKKATERIQEIKQLTFKFVEQKEEGTSEVARIKDTFNTELRSFEDFIINKTLETKQRIQEKIQTRNV